MEKPTNPPHDFAVPGVYFLDKNSFKAFKGKDKISPSARNEYEIPSVYQWLIDHKYKVDVIEYKGKWLDPGKFGDWIESNRYLLDAKTVGSLKSETSNSKIEGRVEIGINCKIKNSEIRGPVNIGDNVIINDSYIGPYTSVQNDCLIEHASLENSVLMSGVKISDVKNHIDESLVGSNATIMRGEGNRGTIKFFLGEKSVVNL